MRRYALILALAIGCAALAAFAALIPRGAAPAPEWRDASLSELRESMRSLVEDAGAKKAYAAFKERYGAREFGAAHNAAHLFGETLYEVEGVPAVAACDTSFNFGCYHGFFTAAVAKEGLEVVAALDAACGDPEEPGAPACQHGIGHGILEYLGHDNLVPALEACDLANQPDPLAGCTGGVFMEYNVPLTYTESGSYAVATRPFIEADGPYAPCGDIPGRFQESCVQELPQWWNQVTGGDFAKMGEWCVGLADYGAMRVCVYGVGKIIPSSADYLVDRAERMCAQMPAEWYDTCITQASWSFEVNTGSHAEALALCAHASEARRKDCPQ